MTEGGPIEKNIGLDNLLQGITGSTSEEVLALKEEIADKYIEKLKTEKENGLGSLIIGEGKSLKDYLVSKNIGDKVRDNIKGVFLGGLFTAVDQKSFEIDGVKYNSIFDYLKPMKEELDAANTKEALEELKKKIFTGVAVSDNTVPENNSENDEVQRDEYIYPVPGEKINSPVGERDPIKGVHETKHIHKGIDIAAEEGTPLLAIANGTVESVGLGGANGFSGYGNYLVMKLNNGKRVLYGHMKETAQNASGTVRKVGDKIKRGDQVGLMGSTGASTGSHLHLEIREGTVDDDVDYISRKYLDPIAYLPVTKDMVNANVLDRCDETAFMDDTSVDDQNIPQAA